MKTPFTPNLFRWLLGASYNWGVIVFSLTLIPRLAHPLSYLLAIFVIGTRQHALGILGHEGAHRLITRHRGLNDFLAGALCFWPLLINTAAWRKFHWEHHRNTGTANDPELIGKQAVAPMFDLPITQKDRLIYLFKDLLGFGFLSQLKMRKATPYLKDTNLKSLSGPLAWYLTLTSILFFFNLLWIIPIWIIALLTSAVAMTRLRLWTEHVGTSGTHRISIAWWQRIYLPHNTWLHWEHHEQPSVPYYHLPKLRIKNHKSEMIRKLSSIQNSFSKEIMNHELTRKTSTAKI